MDRGMVEFYWSLGAEIKIQSILRGAVPVCSSDSGPKSQLMEVRTIVFTHESQLHPLRAIVHAFVSARRYRELL